MTIDCFFICRLSKKSKSNEEPAESVGRPNCFSDEEKSLVIAALSKKTLSNRGLAGLEMFEDFLLR